MSRFRFVVVATCFTLITTLAVACGGDQSTAPPDGPPNVPPPVDTGSGTTVDTATVPATVVDSVATELYLQVSAGEDVTPEIAGILGAFMPVLGEANEGTIDSLLAAGQPFAVDFQAGLIAQSFQSGTMFTVDNFIDAAADAGATALDGTTPITREYLTALLTPVAQQSTYTSVDILPALVLALGRARIRQTGAASTDAVWSDGLLDPLQTTLLMYAVQFAGADDAASSLVGPAATPAPTPSRFAPHPATIGQWALKLKGVGFGIVGSIIGKLVEFPIGPIQSAQATVCASIMMNSYKLQMSASQRDLWHRDPSHPTHPYQSQITAALTFNFVPNALGSWLLPKIGCPIPPVGAAPGKSVTWSTEDPLPDHGGLIDQQLQTDANGQAQATYQTVAELVPGGLQATPEKSVTGLVKASASGLIPGWKRLEATLDYLTPVDEGIRLNVQYHELPQALDVTFQTALSVRNSPAGYNIDVAATGSGQIPLVRPDVVVYGADIPVSYQSFDISTVNPQGCDRVSPAGTTNGTMFAQLSLLPDSSGQLAAAVMASSTPPIEHINVECASTMQSNYLVTVFSAARLDDTPAGFIDSLVVVAPGDLKGTINRTVQDDQIGTITEQTTIELRVVQ
jgi:hypothetical protein